MPSAPSRTRSQDRCISSHRSFLPDEPSAARPPVAPAPYPAAGRPADQSRQWCVDENERTLGETGASAHVATNPTKDREQAPDLHAHRAGLLRVARGCSRSRVYFPEREKSRDSVTAGSTHAWDKALVPARSRRATKTRGKTATKASGKLSKGVGEWKVTHLSRRSLPERVL